MADSFVPRGHLGSSWAPPRPRLRRWKLPWRHRSQRSPLGSLQHRVFFWQNYWRMAHLWMDYRWIIDGLPIENGDFPWLLNVDMIWHDDFFWISKTWGYRIIGDGFVIGFTAIRIYGCPVMSSDVQISNLSRRSSRNCRRRWKRRKWPWSRHRNPPRRTREAMPERHRYHCWGEPHSDKRILKYVWRCLSHKIGWVWLRPKFKIGGLNMVETWKCQKSCAAVSYILTYAVST